MTRDALELTGAEIDTLIALIERGPLQHGEEPSKSGRDSLIQRGLAVSIVHKLEDGWTAATLAGVKAATNWIGYSTDEMGRALRAQGASKNKGKWQVGFPLIRLGLSRSNAIAIVEGMGWPTPPSSSCWMCPNHHMREWREIKNDPRDWPKVVQFDRELRRLDAHAWLTDQPVPIDQVDFSDAQEVLFGREAGSCESGMCFL
ncbi:hypothetical protein [Duganella callida]|uniref:Phosphoadenosine phosphosulfate reductase n=1 Tax=Duganella callida TaxID=2561932 RepID=A0A4Y9S3H5_9BURK|nr:hypothetical protein [Duganella callida]TFW15942.1 hypothetical protein E4L98_24925 [Duganella callida]